MKPCIARRTWLAQMTTAALLAFAALPSLAASVLPLYLDQIIDTSAVAFEGTCTGNRSERDPSTNMVVTYTTFAVHDVLKGSASTTYTIKQIGGDLADEDLHYHVEGVPKFVIGHDYVVFLPQVSRIGFSSPIGLEQGRFSIRTDGGKRYVHNGRDFREMASRMLPALPPTAKAAIAGSASPVRQLDLDQFKQMVRDRVSGVLR